MEENFRFERALEDHDLFRNLDVEVFSSSNPSQRVAVNFSSQLYVLAKDTVSFADLSAVKLRRTVPARTLTFQPEIDPRSNTLTFNRTGEWLAISSDASCSVVRVPKQFTDNKPCRSQKVGELDELSIVHLAWHPLRDTHLLILTSDNILRMFDVSRSSRIPEQVFDCNVDPDLQSLSLFTSFCVGASWLNRSSSSFVFEALTVYLLRNDGQIYALCPVLPFGTEIDEEVYQAMETLLADNPQSNDNDANTGSLASRWLQQAWQLQPHPLASDKSCYAYVGTGEWFEGVVSLQGPLSVSPSPPSLPSLSRNARHMPTATSIATPLRSYSGPTLLIRGFMSGHIDFLLALPSTQPQFYVPDQLRPIPPPSASASSLLFLDRVDLELNLEEVSRAVSGRSATWWLSLQPDVFDLSLLYCRSLHGLHLLTAKWLTPLMHAISHQQDISSILESIQTPCLSLWDSSSLVDELTGGRAEVQGMAYITEPLIGRYVVILGCRQGQLVATVKSPLSLELAFPSAQDINLHLDSASQVVPFSVTIQEFSTRYQQFTEKCRTLLAAGKPFDRHNSDSLQRFLQLRDEYMKLAAELKNMHHQIISRLQLLQTEAATQQHAVAALRQEIEAVEKRSGEVRQQLELQHRLQEILNEQTQEVLTALSFGIVPLTPAEKEFSLRLADYADLYVPALQNRLQQIKSQSGRVLRSGSSEANYLSPEHQERIFECLEQQHQQISRCKQLTQELMKRISTQPPSTPHQPPPPNPQDLKEDVKYEDSSSSSSSSSSSTSSTLTSNVIAPLSSPFRPRHLSLSPTPYRHQSPHQSRHPAPSPLRSTQSLDQSFSSLSLSHYVASPQAKANTRVRAGPSASKPMLSSKFGFATPSKGVSSPS
eukprot:TRINITY_DN15280_c0_g1_i1.p1 TRINITY_DN15280_c0_g1~~TRINITY_DN15280_c0_g1_i1.p1  ORF type:complete len:881 (-),score=186.63 TRINITY_DN15280_c0_g1_i1:42-2684(-)